MSVACEVLILLRKILKNYYSKFFLQSGWILSVSSQISPKFLLFSQGVIRRCSIATQNLSQIVADPHMPILCTSQPLGSPGILSRYRWRIWETNPDASAVTGITAVFTYRILPSRFLRLGA